MNILKNLPKLLFAIALGSTGVLMFSFRVVYASTITTGCASTDSCTLNELFNGGSIQVGQILLSDWSLVNSNVSGTATNFDFNNILVKEETIVDSNGAAYFANNHELSVFGVGRKTFNYDFKVTSLGNNITEMTSPLRYRSLSSLNVLSPFLAGTINVGTGQGSNNIGSATSIYTFNQDINGLPVFIPNLSSFWVRTNIDIYSDWEFGYAELGFFPDGSQGRAYQQLFVPVDSVPEPNYAFSLLSLGALGAASTFKRKLNREQTQIA